MKAILHISVFEEVGMLLNTREAAQQLSITIKSSQCNSIELDFSNVEFMSRSFADQFYKEQLQLKNELNIIIHIMNANEEIIKMLNVVSNTQNKKDREFKTIPVYKFSNPQLLADYLFAI